MQCRPQHGRRPRGVYMPEYATVEIFMGWENLRDHLDSFHIRYADSKECCAASAAIIHADDMGRLRATVNRGACRSALVSVDVAPMLNGRLGSMRGAQRRS